MAARRRGGHRQSGRAACSGAVDLGRPVLPRLPGSQPRAGRAGRWRPFPGAWRIGRLAHACYSPGRGESQMIHLKKEETKAMVAVHGWSGILLGLLLYAVVLTGTAAVFAEEIGAWSAGHVTTRSAFEKPIDATVRRLSAITPAKYHEGVNLFEIGDHGLGAFFHRHEIDRSEEHTSELQSLMRNSYAVFCLKKKKTEQNK